MKNCSKCGQEIDKKAVICPGCGCKVKKPVYKKIWFWILVVIIIAIIGSASGNKENSPNTTNTTTDKVQEEIVYETIDLQTMFDELEKNAMKAEKTYKNKHVEIQCKIANFDSDGAYIGVEPVNVSEWNFTTAMCYIKNDTQEDFLINKNVGDTITIKGKVTSIGELMGYSIDIKEVF